MLSILLFSSLIISSFTVTPTKAVDYTKVGVKVGDWAYYNFSQNTTLLAVPTGTTNIKMTITKIDGSNVTAGLTYYYANGSISGTVGLEGNITSGEYNTTLPYPVLGWFLLVPNLTKNDPVYSGAPYTINSTGMWAFGGLARVYAYINITVSGVNQIGFIDQATGINDAFNASGQVMGEPFQFGWRLNSTSLWSPPSYEVGVKVGDWAHYSFHDNATGMTGFTNANLTITKIDRGNVTASFVWYNSTTQYVSTVWGNVSSGQGSSFPFPFVLIAANLTNADPIWLNNNFAWINETSTATVGGLARALVQINATGTFIFGYLYWDKLTGIAVDLDVAVGGTQIGWNLISTSLWFSTKVGVKVGDWGYYSVRQEVSGLDSGIRNANITVTRIDRGNVTLTVKEFFANGTIESLPLWGNVSNGATIPGNFFAFYLVAANLSKNDPLFPGAPVSINNTASVTIFGESRVCNYWTQGGNYMYWDQATGITTKANLTGLGGPGSYLRWNMTSTSLWSPAPTINRPSAISYVFGSTGHSITWTPTSNVPSHYAITRNGTTVASGNWNGTSIICNVDGLAVGNYAYVCTVNDTIDRSASSTVMVTVTAAPPAPALPISTILVVGGIAVVVIVVVAVVVLRRRRT
jgi:hypothetical protein